MLAMVVVLVLSFAATAMAKPGISNNMKEAGFLTIDFAPDSTDPHPYMMVIQGIGALFISPDDGGECEQ